MEPKVPVGRKGAARHHTPLQVILLLDRLIPQDVVIRHYIDNVSAKQCVVKGYCKKPDINELVGMLWHTASHRALSYYADWVPSAANIADAPSRKDCRLLTQLGSEEIHLDFTHFSKAAERWRACISQGKLTAK